MDPESNADKNGTEQDDMSFADPITYYSKETVFQDFMLENMLEQIPLVNPGELQDHLGPVLYAQLQRELKNLSTNNSAVEASANLSQGFINFYRQVFDRYHPTLSILGNKLTIPNPHPKESSGFDNNLANTIRAMNYFLPQSEAWDDSEIEMLTTRYHARKAQESGLELLIARRHGTGSVGIILIGLYELIKAGPSPICLRLGQFTPPGECVDPYYIGFVGTSLLIGACLLSRDILLHEKLMMDQTAPLLEKLRHDSRLADYNCARVSSLLNFP